MKLYAATILALLPMASAFAPSTTSQLNTKTLSHQTAAAKSLSPSALGSVAVPETAELPEKLYFPKEKEFPKVLGGLQIGLRKLCVVTGASSGLGLNAAATLAKTGRHFVVMAVRDVEKGKRGERQNNGNLLCFHQIRTQNLK